MKRSRNPLARAVGALSSLFVACLAACSGGGGGGSGAVQPQPLGAFAGSWDITSTVTASNTTTVLVGEQQTDTMVITVSGAQATLTDGSETLSGTIVGNQLNLSGAGTTVALTIGSNDQLTGSGETSETANGTTNTISFSLAAVRTPAGGGNALAIATGTWTFEINIEGSPLFFDNGQLTQNGATVTFDYADLGITSVWTGNLSGATWTPTVSGTLTFAITGDFAADGRSFAGTFTSSLLGNGPIIGSLVP